LGVEVGKRSGIAEVLEKAEALAPSYHINTFAVV